MGEDEIRMGGVQVREVKYPREIVRLMFEPDDCHSIPQAKEWPKKVLDDADHLARMVCKLLREDMKGDAGTLMSGERRRLVNLASDWLEQYSDALLAEKE